MVWTIIVLVALTGCTVGPPYVRPPTEVAAIWGRGRQPAVQVGKPIDLRWWESFGEPQLTALVAQGGLATDVEVARARAQLTTTQSAIPTLAAQAEAAIHRLSVLTAQTPMALASALSTPAPIPAPAVSARVSVPATLLRRRPDIRAVERELAAATARIGVAMADLFPRLVLSGTFAWQSDAVGSLFTGNSAAFGIGPSIRWPLFDAGRIRSNIEVQEARQEATLARYEQIVLRSLEEAETALSRYGHQQAHREFLTEALAANQDAVLLANLRYQRGLETFLTVLGAQRDLFQTESELARSETAVSTAFITLYKALGGGWEFFES